MCNLSIKLYRIYVCYMNITLCIAFHANVGVTEMKILSRITNKTKWDRARNDRIRESCEIQNITSWVQRRRIEWSEHISRMADD